MDSDRAQDTGYQSKCTDLAIRHPPNPEGLARVRARQDGANPSACRQSPEPRFSNPLEVVSESPTSDTRPAANTDAADKTSGSSGLSQLLSKVLEQLNISAWLPAAMLVGNVALLLQLHSSGKFDIIGAVKDLAGKPLGTLIVLVFSLLLATIVTQAFEFEIIRLLEGYLNSTHKLIQAGVAFKIRRHARKRSELEQKRQAARRTAFMKARAIMLDLPEPIERAMLDFIEDDIFQRRPERSPTPAVADLIDAVDWQEFLPADTAYRIDCIDAKLDSYPDPSRVLPTRLGNVLRASEDKVPLDPDEDLEGFVIRHYDQLSPAIKDEHKDYRTRLDMYCCLVLVFTTLVPVALGLLINVAPAWGVGIFVAIYGLMAFVCYEAAIASARGYGQALKEIGRQITEATQAE